ncbi:MAG: nucleotidyl transferase AbiEii/AbiGii toxin family protein [Flectobacillus sp.]|uniref:nucleotidyl transferase AbiEii/AbiGii toxin family protein n=1 Tax=Flectobacillus sp. TaxID=50419 RepID=UPI003B9C673F
MKLHEDKALFKDAILFTAQQMNLKPEYVEKDYWVTYALFTIFNSAIGKDTVFKGGTALSKCYNVIERFSEDIDLVVLRRPNETDSKLKAKLKNISSEVEAVLPEIAVEGITQKMGMNRKTAHSYTKEFSGDYGQVRDAIIVEATWLGYYEPYTHKSIVSFIGQMMLDNSQADLAEKYDLLPFTLQVLEPIRTICEKIMSLVRFSYSSNPLDDLKKKIRHTYDLHQLLQQKEFLDFFNSSEFEIMLLKVANDDIASFKNNNQWLVNHPNEALIFKHLDEVWKELQPIYTNAFRNLVFGTLPQGDAVLKTLKMIQERLNPISWSITLEN